MYDDPAFSSDPHAHPFHRPPMLSDDHSSTTHETISSLDSIHSSPPTSADSHAPPPPSDKKKKSLAMFWRRSPPETLLASVDISRNVSPTTQPPPPTMIPPPRPPVPHSTTLPTPSSPNKPVLPPRSATATADFKPPPSAARRIVGMALKGSELDRIDELDESNPIGLPIHHDGPYEAAHKPPTQHVPERKVPHNIGSQYQIPSPAPAPSQPKQDRKKESSQEFHRRHVSDVTSVPIVPAGVSLNLSPGQVLPHNFYYQLDQTMMPPTAPLNAPGWPPQPRSHHRPKARSQSQPQSQPQFLPQPQPRSHAQPQTQPQPYHPFHQNTYHADYDQQRPAEYPPVVHDSSQTRLDGSQHPSRPRNAPPEYSSIPVDHFVSKGDTKKTSLHQSHPLSNHKGEEKSAYDIPYTKGDYKRSVKEQQLYPVPSVNIQSDFRANTPGPRHQQINRLPPRMQALQMQVPRSDEKHRRSPRPPNASLDFAASGGNVALPAGHRRRSHTPQPQMVDHNQPLFIDNNGFPASAPAPPSFDLLQSIRDSVQPSPGSQPPLGRDQGQPTRSIHSSSKSTLSGTPRGAPPPHHIPKRLVMPAPLQASQPVAPRHQPQPADGPYLEHYDWQPQLRPPSPPLIPSALDPYIESQLRAEDMQMAQSRKLRKRTSAQGIPLPPPAQTLQSTPTYTGGLLPQQLSAFRKSDKAQKKVLSKRRSDF